MAEVRRGETLGVMEPLDSTLPCKLDGRLCRGLDCPFWIHGECLVADVDLRGRPDVVDWLKRIRDEIGVPATVVSPRSLSPSR